MEIINLLWIQKYGIVFILWYSLTMKYHTAIKNGHVKEYVMALEKKLSSWVLNEGNIHQGRIVVISHMYFPTFLFFKLLPFFFFK